MKQAQAGRMGGEATSKKHNKEFYQEIGKKGGQATANSHDITNHSLLKVVFCCAYHLLTTSCLYETGTMREVKRDESRRSRPYGWGSYLQEAQ
jgi:general stress protein YciG